MTEIPETREEYSAQVSTLHTLLALRWQIAEARHVRHPMAGKFLNASLANAWGEC